MGQALYRKYRSKSLSEIVGQEPIVTTLQNALKSGAISHAYLFTGPKGVGKTSIARILAYEVNSLPYDESNVPIDIIEIDAASNRRIDEIRQLRDRVNIAPSSAKYKVYIIDEVHMLTKEAFNALLKTLEEPPAHVIFILATTEAHKLPETIISRTQRYTFRPVDFAVVANHLRFIADKEKIKISDEALDLLAVHGEGSFRDSISLLDQVSSITGGKVEATDVRGLLGLAPDTIIEQLYSATFTGSSQELLRELNTLQEQGYEAAQVAKQLSARIRKDVLENQATDLQVQLLRELIAVPASSNPSAYLEVTLLGINLEHEQPAASPKPQAKPGPKSEKVVEQVVEKPTKLTKKGDLDEKALKEIWPDVLTALKKQYNTLYGILRMAVPTLEDRHIVLAFQFPFHQKRIKDTKNLEIISKVIEEQFGQPIQVVCVLKMDAPKPAAPAQAKKPAPPDAISNIFGGVEVLES